ncbi:MAG: SDR family NAD(P)-dependent oxidoreductase [Chthoniobacterales bacterium]
MQRILITGASRGIGRAIAEELAAAGRTLLLHGRDRAALQTTHAEVVAKGADAIDLLYDLQDPAQISAMDEAIGSKPLDILVHNAGIAVVKAFGEISLEEWTATLAVNVTAPFLLTQKLAPRMASGSSIVNILSIAAKTGFPGWSGYCMSKFALEGFSQSLREELRPRGIRVLNIYPGATATDIWNTAEGEWPRDKMMSPREIAEAVGFALSRPASVAIENVTVTNTAGAL